MAMILLPTTTVAQSTQVPEQQNTVIEFIDVVQDCGDAFTNNDATAIAQCLVDTDGIIPQSCYAVLWATFRSAVFLFTEGVARNDPALLEGATFLINEFATDSEQVGIDCAQYTVGEDVS